MSSNNSIWSANLAHLRRTEPALAARLEQAAPAKLDWSPSQAGPLTATIDHHSRPLWLASRFDPLKEAQKLTEAIDYQKTACVVILGMGLGYHVAHVAQQLDGRGILIVFEPDLSLLRAVLERIDHTAWLGKPWVVLADASTDRAALSQRADRYAAMLTQGTQLISHPPSRQRHPEAMSTFSQAVTEMLAYCRTTIATALVNSSRTCRNLAGNLAHYAAGATTNELHNVARGYPAVCVGAGPCLAKNVDLLRDPAVRRNVVLISAQTTLKPLLDRGIYPDFVTALDYSQICQRFYEGLPPLPQVTLVVEPKAHPTILESFPGPIRVTPSNFNDELLGKLARPMIPLRSGATVAHLSFYLAQHLGCDPIIFIGQDLGFSDGLYYAPGTAVHQVWSSELNTFNTVEMMEWQRIVRHKGHLKRLKDVHDQPIFSDEQMLTYLKQFERDFASAREKIIDATEGGLPKAHTQRMTLAEALAQHAVKPVPPIPLPQQDLDADRLDALLDLLQRRLREVADLENTSRQTIPILRKMQEHQRDSARMKKLFEQLHKHQRHVHEDLQGAFCLVNALNTIGAFKRARADRAIAGRQGDPFERQIQQIQRDIENLDWLIQACDEAMEIFREALDRVRQYRQRLKANRPAQQAARSSAA
ncbi:MAG TPA: 6-hydroxymethylpterin diphosphokinase MptE-like protein [Phycisphaeraceae bacterium]